MKNDPKPFGVTAGRLWFEAHLSKYDPKIADPYATQIAKELDGYIARSVKAAHASSQAEIERLTKALTDLLAANDAVQMVLCDGPEVPGFDPMALGRAQVRVTEAEILAREALSGSKG